MRGILFEMRLDRLHHHDRIVDDDADGKHQGEQRDCIGGEAERQHHGEGADQRHRHGDQRDEGRADAAEKQVDYDHDQHEGLDQRMQHRLRCSA